MDNKPLRCPYCDADLDQPPVGRPRRACPRAECQRRAEADRKVRRRRRLAGLPVPRDEFERMDRYPKGGRDPLVRRMARDLAARKFPRVRPTEAELAALELAVRAGATWSTLGSLLADRWPRRWRLDRPLLPTDTHRVLLGLQRRDREADPQYEEKRERRRESRERWRRFWERLRSGNWKARENIFGQLLGQLPEHRRQPVYRALARALHPDVGGDTELMKLLNAAYESFPAPAPGSAPPAGPPPDGDPTDADEAADEAEAMEALRALIGGRPIG